MRSFGRPRLLVVDDEERVRAACERALIRGGYAVAHCGDGEEGLALAARESFDAVLLDVRMPGLDGPAALARFRKLDPDAPVIVISAYADFDAVVALLRDGACEFVPKPFDSNSLVAAVDRALATTHLEVDSALLAATRTIFSSLDAAEITRRVLDVLRSMLQATPAVIGPEDAVEAAAWIGGLRDPVILARAEGDGEVIDAISPDAGEVIAHRLAFGDRPLGLLLASRPAGDRKFGDRDLRRVTLLAGHVALALENARLHEASREQARRLDTALDRLVAAERVATVSRLAAGLGHEIANPATAVLAHIEIAQAHLEAGRVREAAHALTRAGHGADAILDVCRALQPLGGGDRRGGRIDLRTVVEGAVLLASFELRERTRVQVDLPDSLPVLPGDPGKMSQVFLNLLLNAAHAIPKGDPEANVVTITAFPGGDSTLVRVTDTGPGVPPELAARIFEPGTTSKAGTGHGMGLAVCRWILDEMGGGIRLVPTANGACFELELKMSPEWPAAVG